MPVLNTDSLIDNRVDAIRAYHKATGLPRAELDVSGGIDSAVMLMLLAKALGPDNVTAVYSSIHSSDESRDRARLVAKAAGVNLVELDLTAAYEAIFNEATRGLKAAGHSLKELAGRCGADATIAGSLRSCLRAPLGRFMNRLTGNGIRHGTGNECEDRWLRFYQKGGDGEVDTNPVAMLSKGEVYQLSNALGVPRELIEALPSPDLHGTGEGHNDEAELLKLSGVPWTYSRIDPETNEYIRVGTIERMSRYLDESFEYTRDLGTLFGFVKEEITMEKALFSYSWEGVMQSEKPNVMKGRQKFLDLAKEAGLTPEHVVSAIKWERATRHKMNPNCPSLGNREDLIEAGILTNELPKL